MIKAIYFIKRKPGMALEDFRKYWLEEHAALVLKVPGLVKYVQSHTMDSGYRKHEPIYDGIAALWYENLDDMRKTAKRRSVARRWPTTRNSSTCRSSPSS